MDFHVRKLSSFITTVLAALLFFHCGAPAKAASGLKPCDERRVLDGMVYKKYRISNEDERQSIHVLELDIASNRFELESVFGGDCLHNRETVSSMARRRNAIAAINGAFFSRGGNPLGMIVHQGRIIKEPILGRTVMAITSSNEVFFDNPKFDARFFFSAPGAGTDDVRFVELDGINRPPAEDEVIIYTPEYGNTTMTKDPDAIEIIVSGEKIIATGKRNSAIPPDGFVIHARGVMISDLEHAAIGHSTSLELYINPKWGSAIFAVGGGPRLLRDGKIANMAREEKFRSDVTSGRAPRTAIGITGDGRLLLVCVDGRRPKSAMGMSLKELSKFMSSIGAKDAMNLDGGGSTTLYLMGRIMNSPSDGSERPVSQALVLKARDGMEKLEKDIAYDNGRKEYKF